MTKVPGSDVMLAVLHCVHSKLTAWCVIKDYAESQRGEKDAIEIVDFIQFSSSLASLEAATFVVLNEMEQRRTQ